MQPMLFQGGITWHLDSDPERPGFKIWTGVPLGLAGFQIIVQDTGDSEWGWLLMDDAAEPVQMRNGYRDAGLAKSGALVWLNMNPSA